MFGRKDKKNQFAAGGHTLLDHALEITGAVHFGGTLDIEGTVNGDISAEAGAEAILRLRDRGLVQGKIEAPKLIINGRVEGDIFCSEHLELAENAIVNGNVHYAIIEMVKGAQVNGNLVHINPAEVTSEEPQEGSIEAPSIVKDVSA